MGGSWLQSVNLLVISCRLQGKGIGSALIGGEINHVAEDGKLLTGVWKETEYNAGVRALWEWYKAEITVQGDLVTAVAPAGKVELPDWIDVSRV
jgi:hypothetical protein